MAFIGSLSTTGSMQSIIVDEARWKVANDDGTSPGSVSLVIETGDYGNSHQEKATGSIIFVSKDGGANVPRGSIISSPNDDLVLSSSTAHGDIRLKVNDPTYGELNLLTVTAGRSSGGWAVSRSPRVVVSDTTYGYDFTGSIDSKKTAGVGLFNILGTSVAQPALYIVASGSNAGNILEVVTEDNETFYKLLEISNTETVFNDDSLDVDFRVESSTHSHAFYIDGTSDRIGINQSNPFATLDINKKSSEDYSIVFRTNNNSSANPTEFAAIYTAGASQLHFTGSSGKFYFHGGRGAAGHGEVHIVGKDQADGGDVDDSRLWFTSANSAGSLTNRSYIGHDHSESKFIIGDDSTWGSNQRITITDTEIVLNEDSGNIDFRVETDDYSHFLFVDSQRDKLAIGTNTDGDLQYKGLVNIEHTDTTTWDASGASSNTFSDMLLVLKNSTNTTNAFAGIAFDISTDDIGTTGGEDRIGAAIIASRDTAASSTSTKKQTNLIFATNSDDKDDLNENMRITHDGFVGIGARDPSVKLEVLSTATQLKLSYDGTYNSTFAVASDGDTTWTTVDAIIDASGDIELNADNGQIRFKDGGSVLGTWDSSGNLLVNGEVRTTGLAFTDGDDALTIADGGLITVSNGIQWDSTPSVKVNSSTSDSNTSKFIKVAATDTAGDSQDTAQTTLLLTFAGREFTSTQKADMTMILNIKYTAFSSSPYYYDEGTFVTCELLHADALGTATEFEPSTDIMLTCDSSMNAEVWVKSIEGYNDCYVTHLGGTRADGTQTDPGFIIQTGQSWANGITSLGNDKAGQWATKIFDSIRIGSDADGTDRTIVFGHSTLKSVIGIDDSSDVFAINTDSAFQSGNDLEIDASGNVLINNGDLTVGGGDIYGPTDGALTLNSDLGVIIALDQDNDGAQKFKVTDGADKSIFIVAETGSTEINAVLDPEAGLGAVDNYHIQLVDPNNNNDEGIGISFCKSNADNVGAAIVHVRDGGGSSGGLKFYTKASTSNAVAPTVAMTLSSGGDAVITGDLTVTGGDIIGTSLKLDASGDITLDADGSDIIFKDGGVEYGRFNMAGAAVLDLGRADQDYDSRIDFCSDSVSGTTLIYGIHHMHDVDGTVNYDQNGNSVHSSANTDAGLMTTYLSPGDNAHGIYADTTRYVLLNNDDEFTIDFTDSATWHVSDSLYIYFQFRIHTAAEPADELRLYFRSDKTSTANITATGTITVEVDNGAGGWTSEDSTSEGYFIDIGDNGTAWDDLVWRWARVHITNVTDLDVIGGLEFYCAGQTGDYMYVANAITVAEVTNKGMILELDGNIQRSDTGGTEWDIGSGQHGSEHRSSLKMYAPNGNRISFYHNYWDDTLGAGDYREWMTVMPDLDRGGAAANGYIGIYDVTPSYTFDVTGDINATGEVRNSGSTLSSDERLKENISDMPSMLDNVLALRPVGFDWIEGGRGGRLDRPENRANDYGFIAQELITILPNMVSIGDDDDALQGISYGKLVSVLTKAIQEMNEKIVSLEVEVETLKQQ